MAVIGWTHTAHRTYMASLKDNKGAVSVVIKGVDDLFFLYAKRVGESGPYKQLGHFPTLKQAKQVVQEANDKVDAAQAKVDSYKASIMKVGA